MRSYKIMRMRNPVVSGGPYATLSPYYKRAGLTLSNGNLTVERDTSASAPRLIAVAHGKRTGKWYFEMKVETLPTGGSMGIGFYDVTQKLDTNFPDNVCGYDSGGSNSGSGSPGAWAVNDIIRFAINLDGNTAQFARNGSAWSVDPSILAFVGQPFFPLPVMTGLGGRMTFNFGATAFVYSPPAGYSGWTETSVSGRYWRYYKLSGASMAAIVETVHRVVSGGSNVISGGTPSAHDVFSSPTYSADKAIDSNSSTYWNNTFGGGSPYWWQYDYGAGNEKSVVEATLQMRSDSNLGDPTELRFAWSPDGANWYPAYGACDLSWTLGETKTFTWG